MEESANEKLKEKIERAIKFFREYVDPGKYDHIVFQKHWPIFLKLVEEYIDKEVTDKQLDEFERNLNEN